MLIWLTWVALAQSESVPPQAWMFWRLQVGGPIGRVWYYPKHRELRLGQPLTVTKANLALYAKKF
jgi:hypothetical protein